MALVVVIAGLVTVDAARARATTAQGLWPLLVVPLLLAGLGGGGVVSPNFTLTLADVPPRMGGAAGGALQTGQRIGSALGTALMMSVVPGDGRPPPATPRRACGSRSVRRWW